MSAADVRVCPSRVQGMTDKRDQEANGVQHD